MNAVETKVRVCCINDEYMTDYITKGKIYTAFEDRDSKWTICDDWGEGHTIDKIRFVEVKE